MMSKKIVNWDELDEQFPSVVGKKKKLRRLQPGVKYLAIITKAVVEYSSKHQRPQIAYDLHVNTESGEPVTVKKFTQLIPEHEHFLAAELEFFGIEIDHMSELSAKLHKLVGLEVVITISYPKNYGFASPSFVSLVDKTS